MSHTPSHNSNNQSGNSDCQNPFTMGVAPPLTGNKLINGVVVTGSYTGDVQVYTGPTCCLSCEQEPFPLSAITNALKLGTSSWLVNGSPFQYNMSFDRTVNDVMIILRGTGLLGSPSNKETFTFTTNNGVPTINTINSCVSSVSGNQIFSGLGVGQGSNNKITSGGGRFVISTPSGYTQLSVSGLGGLGGSNFTICVSAGTTTQFTGSSTPQSTLSGCEVIYSNSSGQYSLLDTNTLTSSTLTIVNPITTYSPLICKAANLMWILVPTLQVIREYSIANPNAVTLLRSISTSGIGLGGYKSILYSDVNKLFLAQSDNLTGRFYEISISSTTASIISLRYTTNPISTGVNPYRDYIQGITYFYTTLFNGTKQIDAYYDNGVFYASGLTASVGQYGILSFNNRLYCVNNLGVLFEIVKTNTTLNFYSTGVSIPGFNSTSMGFAQYYPCVGGIVIPPPPLPLSGDSCEISLIVEFPCFDLISYTNPSCVCNGSITVDANFGTPPYFFGASDGISGYTSYNGVFTGLCAGDYIISATDSVGYTEILNETISLVNSYNVIIDSFLNGFCVTVSGGTIPYNIYLDNVLIDSVNTDGTTCYSADCATVSVITVLDSTT